jgi:Ca2+-binding RTX toxin-like protein
MITTMSMRKTKTLKTQKTAKPVIEQAGEGHDTVYATGSFTLPAHLEVLKLSGNTAISATGNPGNNILVGQIGANKLTGNGGHDLLSGESGNDIAFSI